MEAVQVPLIARFGIIVLNESVVVVNLMEGIVMFKVAVSDISDEHEELDYHQVKVRILDMRYHDMQYLLETDWALDQTRSV